MSTVCVCIRDGWAAWEPVGAGVLGEVHGWIVSRGFWVAKEPIGG